MSSGKRHMLSVLDDSSRPKQQRGLDPSDEESDKTPSERTYLDSTVNESGQACSLSFYLERVFPL